MLKPSSRPRLGDSVDGIRGAPDDDMLNLGEVPGRAAGVRVVGKLPT
jgi:hypothetical protein